MVDKKERARCQWDSNSWPLDHKASLLPLCHNLSTTNDVLISGQSEHDATRQRSKTRPNRRRPSQRRFLESSEIDDHRSLQPSLQSRFRHVRISLSGWLHPDGPRLDVALVPRNVYCQSYRSITYVQLKDKKYKLLFSAKEEKCTERKLISKKLCTRPPKTDAQIK